MAAKDTLGWYSSGGTWSLAIEEQFYLTLPLIVRFTTRQRLVWVIGAGITAAPILRTAIFFLTPHHRTAAFALMPCRADSLLLGVLGAMLVRNEKLRTRVQQDRWMHIALLTALLLGAAWFGKHAAGTLDLQMATVGYTWMASLYLLVLLFAVIHSGSWLASVLRWRWLRWLGGIAYGIYLYHFQVFVAVFGLLWHVPPERVTNVGGLIACFAALAITLVVCRVSWNYFERPLIEVGHRFKY
jgi:peptidoglycan/LPS O-acetylase OafA/YrhL